MAPLINFGMVRGCWIMGTRCPGRVFVRRSIAKTYEIDRCWERARGPSTPRTPCLGPKLGPKKPQFPS
jgi:hypothetical protein